MVLEPDKKRVLNGWVRVDAMKNKTSFVVPGIALLGVLVYVLSSATQPDMSPVVSDTAASPEPAIPSETSLLEQHLLPREPVTSTRDKAIASPAVTPAQQQAPALEPEIREALARLLNTSSEGLVEETRNGATSVDLQGRFQTVPVATIDENGKVQITDYTHLPRTPTQP